MLNVCRHIIYDDPDEEPKHNGVTIHLFLKHCWRFNYSDVSMRLGSIGEVVP